MCMRLRIKNEWCRVSHLRKQKNKGATAPIHENNQIVDQRIHHTQSISFFTP